MLIIKLNLGRFSTEYEYDSGSSFILEISILISAHTFIVRSSAVFDFLFWRDPAIKLPAKVSKHINKFWRTKVQDQSFFKCNKIAADSKDSGIESIETGESEDKISQDASI